jgi:uncharacterized membrane protein YkoI
VIYLKRIICLILVLCTLTCFGGCKNDKSIVKSGKIPETVKVSVIDNDNKNWLDNSHFEKVNLKIGKDDAYYLELITNDSGKALLKEASEENLGKDLSLIIDEVFLLSVSVPKPIKNGVFKCESKNIDQIYSYNLLTDAPVKTEGLIPPKHLITEEKAKNVALGRLAVSEDSVTNLKISLEFDENWRGWKYRITFSDGAIKYECEVNATFGNIIKFNSTGM